MGSVRQKALSITHFMQEELNVCFFTRRFCGVQQGYDSERDGNDFVMTMHEWNNKPYLDQMAMKHRG
ncbi:hypothetical protein YERSI8AC_290241 [Enterobacterales bacterium 8AC]|nr:hypothetical protein YERSI8AC_290241 [Enterobacterales bacterium 8AC]